MDEEIIYGDSANEFSNLSTTKGFKTANLNGVKYWFYKGRSKNGVMGTCEQRHVDKPKIIIDERLAGLPRLKTVIHELLHGCFDERLKEEEVERISNDIGNVLFRMWNAERDDDIIKERKLND